jgi:hypothetical protein
LKALITWILGLTIAVVLLPLCDAKADGESDERVLSEYVEWFHRNMSPRYAEKAKGLIPTVVKYSHEYRVDPLVIGCIISFESSWRNFSGALGEVGPMHVMPGKWASEFNLSTLDGQIEAGVYRWTLARRCKTLERALTHFGAGGCKSKSQRTISKMKYRRTYIGRMTKKFRNREEK